VRLNGFDSLALTKLDVLDALPEIPVCTAYRCEGETLHEFPSDVEQLEKCEPVYEKLPGWGQPTRGVRAYAELPKNAQRYVERLAELSGCEVGLISTSPDREDTIVRGKSAIAAWFE
jgi:adenylosuccinate synthase